MATSQVVQTSQIPSAFETYYTSGAEGQKGLIPQAFQLYGQGTPAAFQSKYVEPLQAAGLYGAGRIADLTPEQIDVGQQLKSLSTPAQFGSGTTAIGSGVTALTGLPSITDSDFFSKYMSPYMQNVVDTQKLKAIEDAKKTQLGTNLNTARLGTYGGARQLLAQTERERALGTQLGDIQARGLQSAYEAGQRGLEAERAARIQQGLGLGTLGAQYGQLGVAQQAADIDRLKALGAYGDLERAIDQQELDVRYQDLLKGIQFPESQLEKLSGFIRGIPTTDVTQTTTTPPPSFASQLTGLGLSGLGLYRLLNPTG